jgi:hypothetical protein
MPDAVTTTVGSSLIPIDLGSNRKGAVRIPGDVIDYFNIPKPTAAAEEMITRSRAGHRRTIYKGMDDLVGKQITVDASTWQAPVRAAKGGITGKIVKIPTEKKTVKGNIRFVTLHFPSTATVGAISNWIFEKCVVNKPTYFFHNNNRYSVLKATGDVNPGEGTTAPTPTP